MDITAVIVEDETTARAVLREYLSKYCPQVRVLGEAKDIHEAIPLIADRQPQLVFLDVEMPYGNAFDLLEACQDVPFETIFVTAFSAYALKALNMSAAYYLLKPLSIEELILAVNKVQKQLLSKAQINRNHVILDNIKATKPEQQQLILPTIEGFDVVKIDQIIRLKGNGNFTDVFFADGSRKMVCRFLKYFADILPAPFIRVHKTHIVNIHFVKSYHKGTGGFVTLTDGNEVEISPGYKDVFLEQMKQMSVNPG
jgi:two-component system, LytTR family, response regulator